MFVYLDESGDAGFKFERNSSRYFVVTLLLVADPIPLQAAIDDLRRSLGFASGNEFKFSASREEVRWAFLRMLRRQDFIVRALVIDMTLIAAPHLRKRETFYNLLVRQVLTDDDGTIQDATIVLDESVKSRKSKKQLTSYLRRALNTDPALPKVRDVRCHASHADNLIQATDMIAGAIYASLHRGNSAYLDFLRPKVGALRRWNVASPDADQQAQ
jgi:hypothetical protein